MIKILDASEKTKIGYDIVMGVLALIVAILISSEMLIPLSSGVLGVFNVLDKIIWLIFCIDYFIRLYISENKIKFIKKNLIDLLSIIPFNSALKILRILKFTEIIKIARIGHIFKASRVLVLISKFKYRSKEFIKINNFNYAVYFVIIVILLGSIGIYIVEDISFSDALWWCFVTVTTVGYGDIIPKTFIGKIIAIILMIVGIGFVGLLTGTIATFFLMSNKKKEDSYKKQVIDNIKDKLDDFDSITKEDLKEIFKVLEALKND